MTTEAETARLTTLEKSAVRPAEKTTSDEHADHLRAPFVLRIGALLIDYLLVAGLLALLTLPARAAQGATRGGNFIGTFGWWAALGLGAFNFVILPLWRGQTLGKWATGLEIARLDGSSLRLGNALLRHFVGYPLTLLTAGLGFLLTVFNSDNRALHDFIAGTIVTRANVRRRLEQKKRKRRR
jgi:uncharacterized RDD family membrane protein YckC